MLVFVVFVIASPSFQIQNFNPFFGQGSGGQFACFSMVPVAIVAYSAISSIAFMADEVKNPNRNIPIACLITIVVISVIYCLIIFSIVGLVSAQYLAQNPDVQMIPLFVVAQNIADAT